jgi:superfamily I DNA/RNA helicase
MTDGAVEAESEEFERKRAEATAAIVESTASKRLVIAGPGTGKTHTFAEALRAAGQGGLAITFIRNLVADLSDSLDELADVFTFHGFCKHLLHRHPVEGLREGWDYYPPLLELIEYDLGLLGNRTTRKQLEAGLHNLDDPHGAVAAAMDLGNYYNAVSHTDLVYRVLHHFQQNADLVPTYPLIVVDEYQDFSLLETSFIALLADKSPVLIAGDDDQALYSFKNASARYIRDLAGDDAYARFPLPFCSRCTAVVVEAVNATIEEAVRNGNLAERLEKPFECYVPSKRADSEAYPKIIHARCTVERNNARYVGRYVTEQIDALGPEDIAESRDEGYPTVLVIGPTPFLERAYGVIKERFPQAHLKMAVKSLIGRLDAYRRLARDAESRLAWRILLHVDAFKDSDALLKRVLESETELLAEMPEDYRERHLAIAALVQRLLSEQELDADEEGLLVDAVGLSMAEIREALLLEDESEDGEEGAGSAPPEGEPTDPSIVCTSLVGAKGLSASYVFVVGFNNGHLPRDEAAITDEEVCCFLVALSRTRKECHLVSCRRFGNEPLQGSEFGRWIAPYLEERVINAAYFTAT